MGVLPIIKSIDVGRDKLFCAVDKNHETGGNSVKKVGKPVFIIIVLLIAAMGYLTTVGVTTYYGDTVTRTIKGIDDIRWGIDIRGGVDVTFSPPEGVTASSEDMGRAKTIIENRLVSQNITDSEVYTDYDKHRIIVRFPWKADETDFNPEKAIAELGETASLTFRELAQTDPLTDAPAGVTLEKVVLEGRDVESAYYGEQPDQFGRPEHVVVLNLKPEGAQKFEEATGRLVGQQISIWMDETMLSAPVVNAKISGGEAVISGNFTPESAAALASKINAGALPFKLVTENYNTISPTLGAGAKDAMLLAGAVAFALVALLIVVKYRLPGFVAVIALAGQLILMIASLTGFFSFFPAFTLTLPGIAGIILAIGFGVDANIITAERIKEELHNGRSLDGAIESGFNRAFSAILDSNVTVIIVAIILMGAFGPPDSLFSRMLTPVFFMFGPSAAGAIYSFGFTLLVGVILNLVMGVFASRLMIKSLSRFAGLRNPRFYGGAGEDGAGGVRKVWSMDFISRKKLFFALPCAFLTLTLAGVLLFGVNLDIQFKGGALITYSYEGNIDRASFQRSIEGILGESVNLQESTDVVTGANNFVVSLAATKGISSDKQLELGETLAGTYAANNLQTVSINVVNPTIGSEFLHKSMMAVGFASLLMVIYISLRFKRISGLSAGVTALFALLNDLMMVFAVFVLFRLAVNANFIAVCLTILGYSLNDTIVVYDRIRENKRLYGKELSTAELVNKSLNQSFTRSLMTTVTTVTAMVVVTVVALIFNVGSIISFSFPMIIGMLSGFFSSVCVAPNLWVLWQEKKAAKA